jgi:phenylpropionate dioxygenase-like ring-hydroxylating dioxygenase large terminal subunit
MNPAYPPYRGSVEEIARDVIAAASLPLEKSTTLPREAYTDQNYFLHEVKTMLETDWICLGHVSQVKQPGSYISLELFGEPLIVLRDKDGSVRILSRVCPHRAMDIMPPELDFGEFGQVKTLVCPYHRWSFDFSGKVKGCPEMHLVEDFDKAEWKLAEFRSEIWEGFIFARIIRPWKTAEMEVVIALEWECEFNWKVMVENWNECYHHLGIHHKTLNPIMPAHMTWAEASRSHYTRCHLPYQDELVAETRKALAGGPPMPGFDMIEGLSFQEMTEWGLYVGFPCFMFLTMPDRVLWYRIVPVSANRCKLLTTTLIRPENKLRADWDELLVEETKLLRDFHLEDMQICNSVQRGLYSRTVARGRLSHLEETVWQMYRYYAARLEGRYPEAHAGGKNRSALEAVMV